MNKEMEIPEGYEARIEGNKVILDPKESEDERIRKELLKEIEFIIPREDETDCEGLMLPSYHARIDKYRSYLEQQKEQKPAINIEHLKSYMLQYLQDAANREDDSEIEADTDKWAKMIIKVFEGVEQQSISTEETELNSIAFLEQIGYTCIPPRKEQRPAEWSEEEKMHLANAILAAEKEWGAESRTAKFLKSLRPQPRWKPSKEQMWALDVALENFYDQNDRAALNSLKIDLQKLL